MSTSRRSILLSAATVGGVALGAGTSSTQSAAAATPANPAIATVALGSVSGNVTLDLSQGATFTCTLTNNTVFTFTNWPAGAVSTEPMVISTQDATGGHSSTFTGVSWLPAGSRPVFQTGANQVSINCFVSEDNGTTVYGQSGSSSSGGGGGLGVYGDGSDGALVLDGTATYPGLLGKSGTYYWLLRDTYASSVVVAAGVTLQLAGGDTPPFRLFCSGLLNIVSGGSVVTYVNSSASKAMGGSLTGGAAATAGTTGAGASGGNVVGQSGLAAGQGGSARSGATPGGAAGVSSLPTPLSLPKALPWAATMSASGPYVPGGTVYFPGGASGGAGAGDGTNAGGAGGAGGNPLFIAAATLVNNGSIAAYGGKGGDATGGDAGGGGGGQGGPIMLIYGTYTGGNAVTSVGGAGGVATAGGASGTNGSRSWTTRLVN